MAAEPTPVVVADQETKPGYETTEFWITIFTNIFALLNLAGAWDYVPNKWSAIAVAIVNGAYAVSRGQAKQGIPYQTTAAITTEPVVKATRR